MLTREQALRDSDAVQARYDDYHGRGMASPEAIEIDVQRQVLREHGYADCDASLGRYWQIAAKWIDAPNARDDPELRNSVVYLKYRDLTLPLTLAVGDDAPDAALVGLDGGGGRSPSLLDRVPADGTPLVVVGGSAG